MFLLVPTRELGDEQQTLLEKELLEVYVQEFKLNPKKLSKVQHLKTNLASILDCLRVKRSTNESNLLAERMLDESPWPCPICGARSVWRYVRGWSKIMAKTMQQILDPKVIGPIVTKIQSESCQLRELTVNSISYSLGMRTFRFLSRHNGRKSYVKAS